LVRHGHVDPVEVGRQPDQVALHQAGHRQGGPAETQALLGRVGGGPAGERLDQGEGVAGRHAAQVGPGHLVVADHAGQVQHGRRGVVDVDLQPEPGAALRVDAQPGRRAAGSPPGDRRELADQAGAEQFVH
jgi:hypothetical protein